MFPSHEASRFPLCFDASYSTAGFSALFAIRSTNLFSLQLEPGKGYVFLHSGIRFSCHLSFGLIIYAIAQKKVVLEITDHFISFLLYDCFVHKTSLVADVDLGC